MAAKRKSRRQVRFLFSKRSPLTVAEKTKLAREIRTKRVKIINGKRRRARR